MNYLKRKKHLLINITLCICSLTLAIGCAEYILRRIPIEGLSGRKIYVGERGNSIFFPLLTQAVARACKDFEFTSGVCYPSDASGRMPLKVINPYDGKNWFCVAYNKKSRLQGYNPDRKRQIGLVGDSFVFGEGVKETDTLGYLLNDTYPKINFQNWGKPGANIGAIVKKCNDIIKSSPKVEEVIYVYNLNDVRMSNSMAITQENVIWAFQNIYWDHDEESFGIFERLLSKSKLFLLCRKVLVIKRESYRTIYNYENMYMSEDNRERFLSTMDEIKSMKDMLAEHGIAFRMIIYPLLYKNILGQYPFQQIHHLIIRECQKRGIICLDGYEPFRDCYSLKRFAVNPLDYHPNGLSNQKLVNYIHENNFITDIPE